jgi:hypothetical protein
MMPPDARTVARLLAAYAVLTLALWLGGHAYSLAWCDAFAALLGWLQDAFTPITVGLAVIDGQPAFEVQGLASPALVARYPVMPAATRWTAGTLQAYAHLHLVLVLAPLLAWPAAGALARLRLLAGAVPAVAVATCLDLPFALHGLLLTGVHQTLDPDALATDPAVLYFEFLQRGGRLVLPLAAAGLVIARVAPARSRARGAGRSG